MALDAISSVTFALANTKESLICLPFVSLQPAWVAVEREKKRAGTPNKNRHDAKLRPDQPSISLVIRRRPSNVAPKLRKEPR